MICPVCHSEGCHRSRRRGLSDNLVGLTGLRPWRCRTCETRFFAWVAPARFFFHVHCPHCGSLNLQTVARDRVVESWFAPLWRLLRCPAYRCDDCRSRFFSIRQFRPIKPARADETLPVATQKGEARGAKAG